DTEGLKDAVADSNTSDWANHLTDGFYLDNGKHTEQDLNNEDFQAPNTGVFMDGGADLDVRVLVVQASGGVHANIDLHLDPSLEEPGPNHIVRLSALTQRLADQRIPFKASGEIYVTADLAVLIPNPFGPDIVLAHKNIGHITIVSFGEISG